MKNFWSFDTDTGRTIINLDEIAQFRRVKDSIEILWKSGESTTHVFLNEGEQFSKEVEDKISLHWGLQLAKSAHQ